MNSTIASFPDLQKTARRRLIKMHYDAGVGHLGGNLSALDTLLFLHHHVMNQDDIFVLSKGHAVGALYITLWTKGILSDTELYSFHANNTRLPGHPPPNTIDGIPVATGSLGHGLPISCGIAIARKLVNKNGRIFCLCSDGEWQEGSNWEALIFSRHHNLDNLVILVDVNKLQGFGTTMEVASMASLKRNFESFDLNVSELDGHDFNSLSTIQHADYSTRNVYLLNTVKGKGISFMENILDWHYLPLTEDLYELALKEQGE